MNWRRGLQRTWMLAAAAWFAFACWFANPLPQIMAPRAASDPAPVLAALENAQKVGVGDLERMILEALRKADAAGDAVSARRLARMYPQVHGIGVPEDSSGPPAQAAADDWQPVENLDAAQKAAIAAAQRREALEFEARSAVEAYQPVNKWMVLGKFSAFAFLPPLLVLGIGLALGWALRGFRGDNPAPSN